MKRARTNSGKDDLGVNGIPRSAPTSVPPSLRGSVSEDHRPGTWVIVGASRGIGLEFVRQILENNLSSYSPSSTASNNQHATVSSVPIGSMPVSTGSAVLAASGSLTPAYIPGTPIPGEKQVIAVVRDPMKASELWQVAASQNRPGRCLIEQCDVTKADQIEAFAVRMQNLVHNGLKIEGIVLNAGVLNYPNRAMELSFQEFATHLHTNTIGPIIIAQKLLNLSIHTTPGLVPAEMITPPAKIVFVSSDSGSATKFLEYEDGFAAYAASKAALNQAVRHLALELKRRHGVWEECSVLLMHPGEVATDMANLSLDWEVEGTISAKDSVEGMLEVITTKTKDDSGTFWCWDGRKHPW